MRTLIVFIVLCLSFVAAAEPTRTPPVATPQGKVRPPSFSQETAPPTITPDGEVAVLRDRVLGSDE